MDLHALTTTPDLISELPADLAPLTRCVQGLLDRAAIRDLGAIYAMAVDDHDIERVLDCFAPDGSFARADARITGRDELRTFYIKMMDRYATTLHTPNSHVVAIDGPGTASGMMTGHAELSLDGTLMIAAYRYDDAYRRIDGRWVFGRRWLRFMYVTPFTAMEATCTGSARIRWPGLPDELPDFPESLATWDTYR